MTFCSCDAIGTSVGVTWCHKQQKCHHCISWIKMIEMRCNLVLWYQWNWCQCHMLMASAISPRYFLGQDNWNELQLTFWSCDAIGIGISIKSSGAYGIVSGTFTFLKSRQAKWTVTWMFRTFDASGIGVGIKYFHQHCQWYHCIPYFKVMKIRCNMTFLICDTIGIGISITLYPWCWHHMTSVAHDANSVINGTTVFLNSRWLK